MARVFSDGGTMTVGRRQNHWTWGSFSVVLKVGDQQIEQNTALQDGYVYRPDDRGTGRAELTFGRADAQIDMNHESSDMEYTLDAASKRASGDVFYTREIEGLGLANTKPGVDYEQGDMIEVVVWSQILDSVVAGVIDKATAENPNGQAVVVGENALSDAAAYRKRNSEIWNQLAKERAERIAEAARLEREDARIAEIASTADSAARSADALATQGKSNTDRIFSNQSRIASNVNSQKEYMYNTRYIIRAVKNLVKWTGTANGILTTQLNVNSTQLSSLSGNNSGAYNNINHDDLNEWSDRNNIPITGPSWT